MHDEPSAERLELRLLLEAIYLRYGYDFRKYAEDSMARRVQAAAAKVGARHLGELQHRLLTEPETFSGVLDVLTVRVTEMFRDPSFYRALQQLVVPVLRTYPQLKIWHAGCASGEEVYATAILLTEAGLYERSQIYATDMSSVAVEQAREGVYLEALLSTFEQNYRAAGGARDFDSYWSRAYGRVSIRPALKQNVHFFQHDLVSDYSLGEMHVVFCRNVLIYFGDELRQRVFRLFADGLVHGGFLCLGSSESLPAAQRPFYQELSSADRIFRQRSAA
ncbi:MAG TPA: protein-glutamate O-methyltransferase CheR [Polyangiaceae bacterium]|nr:protein-glutamate O-methyltransferase CheR [Polyangiaceae bacterium]